MRRTPQVAPTSRLAPAASTAPVEPDQFGRAAGEIPIATECARARGLGACDGDVLADPVAAVADDDVPVLVLTGDRLHHAFDDLRNLEDAGIALDLVDDLLGAHAEEAADEDFQQTGRAAGLAGEDAGERLDRIDRGALVDEQAGGPVAARQWPRDIDDQADIDAGDIGVLVMSFLDTDAGPGLAVTFRRRMLAERDHARAEDRAVARHHEVALELPVVRHGTPCTYRGVADHNAKTASPVRLIPAATKITPSARLTHSVVSSFSIVIKAPKIAIHTTFITPKPNISSIIAQQQPTQ